MEKQSKTMKKLLAIFWFMIYAMPLILIVILFINGTYRKEFTLEWNTVETYMESIASDTTIVNLSTLFNNYLGNFEKLFLQTETLNNLMIVINALINYYVIMKLIHIIVDLIMFIPNVVKKLMGKVGVKDVE